MLEVLAHPDLPHELVLVTVHARELTDVGEGELETVGELEGVDVAEAVLDVRVDDELGEAEDLATEVEGVSEAGLLALLGRERLDGLEAARGFEVSTEAASPKGRKHEERTSCCSRGGGS